MCVSCLKTAANLGEVPVRCSQSVKEAMRMVRDQDAEVTPRLGSKDICRDLGLTPHLKDGAR